MQIPRADIFLIPLEAHKMSVDIRIVRPELQAIWDRAQTIIYLRDTADLSSSAIIHGGKQPFVLVTDTMDRMMA